jgi:hypothetical protein
MYLKKNIHVKKKKEKGKEGALLRWKIEIKC